jgi:hypothetical protein
MPGKDLTDEIFSLRDPGPTLAYFVAKAFSTLDPKQRHYHFSSPAQDA